MSLKCTPITRASKITSAETRQVSDFSTAVRLFLTSIAPVKTCNAISKHGVCLDVSRWRRLRAGLPAEPNPAFEKRGLHTTFFQSLDGHGNLELSEDQVLRITTIQVTEAKAADLVNILEIDAEVARKTGSVETFWVIQETADLQKFRLITRFKSRSQDAEFNELKKVTECKRKLVEIAESVKE